VGRLRSDHRATLAVIMTLATVPEWLATALLGAVLASLGYVAKQLLDWWSSVRKTRRERRARLVTLLSLLRGSKSVYLVQAELRNRLADLLSARRSDLHGVVGYDAQFAMAFASMTPQERELHDVIRGYTIHGTLALNEAVLSWLATDSDFKIVGGSDGADAKLAAQLGALEAHLLLWRAKYQAWIPDAPARALVYLNDEERHGVAFPRGIEDTIAQVLRLPASPAEQRASSDG
jgi:hypothetical protein